MAKCHDYIHTCTCNTCNFCSFAHVHVLIFVFFHNFIELKLKYDNLKKQYSELLSQYKQSKTPPPSSPPHQSGTIRTLQEDKMILTSQVEAYKVSLMNCTDTYLNVHVQCSSYTCI